MDFDMFFGISIFNAKWGFCMGYSLCRMADFQNGLISPLFSNFLERFFAPNNSKWFVEWILTCFFFCMMADFQNGPISRIVSVFLSGFFAQNNSKWFVEWILTCFLEFLFLTQSEDFAWVIAFAWWPIFKMVPFLEYLVFFGALFCTEQL